MSGQPRKVAVPRRRRGQVSGQNQSGVGPILQNSTGVQEKSANDSNAAIIGDTVPVSQAPSDTCAIQNGVTGTTSFEPVEKPSVTKASSDHNPTKSEPKENIEPKEKTFEDAVREQKGTTSKSNGATANDVAIASDAFSRVSLQDTTPRTLYEAVRHDDIELLNELLKDKAGVKDQLDYALTSAVMKKSTQLVEILLKHGANPKYMDHCYPLLMTATDLNHMPVVELLLEYGADPNVGGMHGTALHSAMRFGSVSLAQKLIEAGAKLDGSGLFSLFLIGIQTNNLNCLDVLLDKGYDVKTLDEKGRSLLHIAAQQGKGDVIKHLLNKGLDPLTLDSDGFLPWMWAIKNKHKKDAELLFPTDVDCIVGNQKRTPLHCACNDGLSKCVERLLMENANVNLRDSRGRTPLMLSVKNGHIEVAFQLLALAKPDVNIPDEGGHTVLFFALQRFPSYLTLAEAFIKLGADVNAKFHNGSTAVMDFFSRPEVIKWLLEKGADLCVVANDGHTLLGGTLAYTRDLPTVEMLLEHNEPMSHVYIPAYSDETTPFEQAVLREGAMMKLLFYAGCSWSYISKYLNSTKVTELRETKPRKMKWLEDHVKQAPSLMEMARNTIMASLGSGDMDKKMKDLSLPSKLHYLFHVKTFVEWKKKQYEGDDVSLSSEDDDDYTWEDLQYDMDHYDEESDDYYDYDEHDFRDINS